MRVLLVEDDGFVRLEIAEVIRDSGLAIVEARDGVAALDLLRTYPGQFDGLIADLTLPGGVDGASVAELMRVQRPDAPVILVSGNSTALAGAERAEPGVHVLTKPFHARDLLALLRPSVVAASGS